MPRRRFDAGAWQRWAESGGVGLLRALRPDDAQRNPKETRMTSRRTFVQILPAFGAILVTSQAHAQAMVDEKDPVAASLGYVSDSAKADKAKYPKHAAGQHCAGCALFQGKVGATAGSCPLFAGKQVVAKGWCSAYTQKA
jgi:hypothetical protein